MIYDFDEVEGTIKALDAAEEVAVIPSPDAFLYTPTDKIDSTSDTYGLL